MQHKKNAINYDKSIKKYFAPLSAKGLPNQFQMPMRNVLSFDP